MGLPFSIKQTITLFDWVRYPVTELLSLPRSGASWVLLLDPRHNNEIESRVVGGGVFCVCIDEGRRENVVFKKDEDGPS